ncbi:MAG: glutamate--tRNA ligase, partial [Candidatus Thorarchaeota archaeon]
MERLESEIRRFVLENAVKYDGKPNANSVMSALMSARADLRPMAREVRALVERLVAEISGLGLSAQKSELARLTPSTAPTLTSVVKEGDTGLPDLPNVDKWPKVVMRLAPFPSGPLHIGNARMVILNDYYVKRYDGKLILVFDDTIGSEEKQVEPTAYDLIPEGLEYLGVKYHQTVYKSDRLDLFYDYSVDLIKKEHAYVCTCDPQKWRTEHKAKKKPCPCRTLRVEENLSRWEKMLDGTYAPGEAALRMKTGMDDPDPAMRDHVIMRISETVHPRVGTRYRVWPLLEFSWGIDDHELGISHIIRGKDLVKEGKIEQHVWAFYGWQFPELLYYGRLKIEGVKLSKSKSRREVMEGAYRGWDDPRTWSIQSLQKRGIHPDALRKAILDLGMSLSDASLSVKSIYSENRRLRDADAP